MIVNIIVSLVLSVFIVSNGFCQTKPNDLPTVDEVNASIQRANAKWVTKPNRFSTMSQKEIDTTVGIIESSPMDQTRVSPDTKNGLYEDRYPVSSKLTTNPLPSKFDWRNHNGKNYVTPVKYQASCGACVTFATLATWESLLKIKYLDGDPYFNPDLSEQYTMSCPNILPCAGVHPQYEIPNMVGAGTYLERHIPYLAQEKSCAALTAGLNLSDYAHYGVTKYERTMSLTDNGDGDVNLPLLKRLIVEVGPIWTTMNIHGDLYLYGGGIYTVTQKNFKGYHAVTLVGYNDEEQYFIVKNSWGTWWGEEGYIRVAYSQFSKNALMGMGLEVWAFNGAYKVGEDPISPEIPAAIIQDFPSGYAQLAWKTYYVSSSPNTITQYKYKLDGADWSPVISVSNAITIPGPLSEGTHTLEVINCISESYCQQTTTKYEWIHDTIPPVFLQIDNPPSSSSRATAYTFNVSASTDTVTYDWVSDVEGGVWHYGVPISSAKFILNNITPGQHYILIRPVDAAGNPGNGAYYQWTTVADTLIAIINDAPAATTTDDFTSITITSNDGNCTGYRYRLDGGNWSATIDKATKLQLSGLLAGTHVLEVLAVDSYGYTQSETAPTSYTWKVLSRVVTATLQTPPVNLTEVKVYTLNVTGTNAVAYRYALDNGAYSTEKTIGTPITLNLQPGLHKLELIGKNSDGVWQTVATTYTWTIKRQQVQLGPVLQLLLN